MFDILIRISLNFVPDGPIDNKLALVQVMAWRRTGDKPLSEPMLNQFMDAYVRHWGEMQNFGVFFDVIEYAVEQTVEFPETWDTMTLM